MYMSTFMSLGFKVSPEARRCGLTDTALLGQKKRVQGACNELRDVRDALKAAHGDALEQPHLQAYAEAFASAANASATSACGRRASVVYASARALEETDPPPQ